MWLRTWCGRRCADTTPGGVAPTAKHFPGHGSTTTDSHASTAVIADNASTWRRRDRPPFEAAVRNHVDVVMLGHLAFPAVDRTGRPATISGPLTRGCCASGWGSTAW